MSRAQNQIVVEQDSVAVCLAIYRYGDILGLNWTVSRLLIFTQLPGARLLASLEWLGRKSYIVKSLGAYYLTDSGREYVESLSQQVSIGKPSDLAEFKSEVLSGLTEYRSPKSGFTVTRQSLITRGALPGSSRPHVSTTPEDKIIKMDNNLKRRQAMAVMLKVTSETLEKYLAEGRIRICKKCRAVGVFDKKGANRFHSICRRCRKAQRKDDKKKNDQNRRDESGR